MQPEQPKDFYQELGVDRNASKDEIQKAYRKQARKKHPDAGGSVEEFQHLALIVDTLTDDARRAHYDARGQVEPPLQQRVQQNAQGLLENAFCGEREIQDPMKWIREQIKNSQYDMERQRDKFKNLIKRITQRIEKFKKQNEQTTNKKSRDFTVAFLASRIEHLNRQVAMADKELQLMVELTKFFDELTTDPNGQKDMQQYARDVQANVTRKIVYGSWQ